MSREAPLRVGLIGAGGIAQDHMRAFEQHPDRIKLVAVCDVREALARGLAAEAGVSAVYTDASKMLALEAIDAVAICTTHDTHAPLSIAAIESGRHVFVEKPMACSLEQCRAMVSAAERAGVILMVGQNQRYAPSYRQAHLLVREGELGTIRAARCDAMQNLPDFVPSGHWLLDGKTAGGGVVISLAVHPVDLLRYFVGEITRVTSVTRVVRPEFLNQAEDYAVALFEFENGAVGELFATWSAFRAPWVQEVTIFGDEGTLHTTPYFGDSPLVDPVTIASRSHLPKRPAEWSAQFGGFENVEGDGDMPSDDDMINEMLHFAHCCATGDEPISSGRDNLGTMAAVFGIYESARTGATVTLGDIR